ncbi:MAG: hypothetical protein AB7T38_05225 [Nitrospirales bacterium]
MMDFHRLSRQFWVHQGVFIQETFLDPRLCRQIRTEMRDTPLSLQAKVTKDGESVVDVGQNARPKFARSALPRPA